MKKKLLITFGTALSLLALASCGSDTDNGKALESTVVKDVFGITVDNRSYKKVVSTEEGASYEYLLNGYYLYSPTNGNILIKNIEKDSFSVDLGVKKEDLEDADFNGRILELVKEEGTSYKHIFYSFDGNKIIEKVTDFYYTFYVNTIDFTVSGVTDYIDYNKYDYEYSVGDVVTKFSIYEKIAYDIKNDDTTYEFKTTPFETTEVVKDSVKIGDYYAKNYQENNDVIIEFYDAEGKLDDKLIIEDGSLFTQAYSIDDYSYVYQRSIPVTKTDDYDYFNGGVYYKLESFMLDINKHKVKNLDLRYVVTNQISQFDGEYAAITYRNIIDRKLEYTSIGFVNDSFDIKYSLPNESSLKKVNGGYFSTANNRLYNENFEIVKEFKAANSVKLSPNNSYIVVTYSDYITVFDTATGNIITEGTTDKLSYNNLIVKKDKNVSTYYDVVNGSLVKRYSTEDSLTTSINNSSTEYYVVKEIGLTVDTCKIYSYGSNTAMTAYANHTGVIDLSRFYDNKDFIYYSVSGLYTDEETTTKLKVCKIEQNSKKDYLN